VGDLPLKVRNFDAVVVGKQQMSHAGGRQVHGDGRTEPTEPYDQHPGCQQPLLAVDVDLRQQDLAAVAKELLVVHRTCAISVQGSSRAAG